MRSRDDFVWRLDDSPRCHELVLECLQASRCCLRLLVHFKVPLSPARDAGTHAVRYPEQAIAELDTWLRRGAEER